MYFFTLELILSEEQMQTITHLLHNYTMYYLKVTYKRTIGTLLTR